MTDRERIKQLHKQAFDLVQYQLQTVGSYHSIMQRELLKMVNEKFAELIVQECTRARLAQPEPEPLEYWNAVEGWVKIDEVRQHFDTAGCGTIYKTGGEGRVPLYAAPQREWVGLTDDEYELMAEKRVTNYFFNTLQYARDIEQALKDKNT